MVDFLHSLQEIRREKYKKLAANLAKWQSINGIKLNTIKLIDKQEHSLFVNDQ